MLLRPQWAIALSTDLICMFFMVRPPASTKEMTQPCLIYLYIISLFLLRERDSHRPHGPHSPPKLSRHILLSPFFPVVFPLSSPLSPSLLSSLSLLQINMPAWVLLCMSWCNLTLSSGWHSKLFLLPESMPDKIKKPFSWWFLNPFKYYHDSIKMVSQHGALSTSALSTSACPPVRVRLSTSHRPTCVCAQLR